MRSTLNGTSMLNGSSNACSGSDLGASGSGVALMRTVSACTSPSLMLRSSSGAKLQPMRALTTSTAIALLLQRSQPICPPPRSEPLTSRVSSCCSGGNQRAACASVVANEVLRPDHIQAPVAISKMANISSASRPLIARHARERCCGGAVCCAAAAYGLTVGGPPAAAAKVSAPASGGMGVRVFMVKKQTPSANASAALWL